MLERACPARNAGIIARRPCGLAEQDPGKRLLRDIWSSSLLIGTVWRAGFLMPQQRSNAMTRTVTFVTRRPRRKYSARQTRCWWGVKISFALMDGRHKAL